MSAGAADLAAAVAALAAVALTIGLDTWARRRRRHEPERMSDQWRNRERRAEADR